MAKAVREWAANTSGNPGYFYLINLGPQDVAKYLCRCEGVLDYIYHSWWKCRQCQHWAEPKV